MTKKDYELIAMSVWRSRHVTEFTEKNQVRKQARLAMSKLIASDLAGTLSGDNPRFDQNRFLQACGVTQ